MIELIALVLLYSFCFYTEYLFGPNVFACVGIAIVGYFVWLFANAGVLAKKDTLPFINPRLLRVVLTYGGVVAVMLLGSASGPFPLDDMMLLSYFFFFLFCVATYAINFCKGRK